MVSFVVSRKGSGIDRLLEMNDWCLASTAQHNSGWSLTFAYENDDNYARFTFDDETLASWFALRWGEFILEDDHWLLILNGISR